MSVRNFWFDAYVDGRERSVCGGPRPSARDDGMDIDIYQRKEGQSMKAIKVRSFYDYQTDECVTQVISHIDNEVKYEVRTKR